MKISVFYAHVREAAAQAACDPKDLLPVLTGAGITGLEMDLNELGDLSGTKAMLDETGMEVSNICCMFRWSGSCPHSGAARRCRLPGLPQDHAHPRFLPGGLRPRGCTGTNGRLPCGTVC